MESTMEQPTQVAESEKKREFLDNYLEWREEMGKQIEERVKMSVKRNLEASGLPTGEIEEKKIY